MNYMYKLCGTALAVLFSVSVSSHQPHQIASVNSTVLQGRKNGRKQAIVCAGSTVLVKNISSFHKYLYFVSGQNRPCTKVDRS